MATQYWKLDDPLRKVLSKIKINEDERKRKNEVFHAEINKIVSEMKKDVVFKRIFRKLNYGGSTYENLKISAANEFDLNLELVLPVHKGRLKVENSLEIPGFVFLCVDDINEDFTPDVDENVRKEIRKWFSSDGNLLRTKVYQWMHGVLDRALNDYRKSMSVRRSMSGPALTLTFEHVECGTFSVDLSPVFPFGVNNWPDAPVRHYNDIPYCGRNMDNVDWFAVPKSPSDYRDNPKLWRISFYQFELEIMNGREQLKPVLKLMKCLRDRQDWKQISSYYLKTIFMWAMCSEDLSLWRKSLGEIFIIMLGVIQQYLLKREIPFFWNEELNLIKKLNPEFPSKVERRIEKMKKRILNNLAEPRTVLIYFMKEIPEQMESSGNITFENVAAEEGRWCSIL